MKRLKAFTLVELLVVIGIIAVLVAILLPTLGKAREQAQRTVCAANLQQVGSLWHMYAIDFKGYFPASHIEFGNWNLLHGLQRTTFIEKYKLKSGKIFYCPEYTSYHKKGQGSDISQWELDWNRVNTETTFQSYFIGYQVFTGQIMGKRWSEQEKNNFPPPFKNNERRLAERPLVFDQTVSVGGKYGTPDLNYQTTSHLDRKARSRIPAGGNAVYGDGHVAWRPWKEMIPVFHDSSFSGGFTRYY